MYEVVGGKRNVHSFLTKRWSRHDLFACIVSIIVLLTWCVLSRFLRSKHILSRSARPNQYDFRKVVIHTTQFLFSR